MQTFDPTTNRIPFGLLTTEEQRTLQAWPHGWKFFTSSFSEPDWTWIEEPSWETRTVYRGRPAPIVHYTYINVYKNGNTGLPFSNLADAKFNRGDNAIKTIRVDTVGDKVSVTVLD